MKIAVRSALSCVGFCGVLFAAGPALADEDDRDHVPATDPLEHVGAETVKTPKWWQVSGGFESHVLVVQNDLEGAAPDKFWNYFYAGARVDLAKIHRFRTRLGAFQRFIGDPGESGARFDDMYFAYTLTLALPKDFQLATTASAIAPTSFISQKMGLITAPRVTLQLSRPFGKYVELNTRVFGQVYIQQYTSREGGAEPNPIGRTAIALEGEVSMPFHPALGAGLGIFTAYTWYYQPNATLPPGSPGLTESPYSQDQPTQQTYGGEAFVRYDLPRLAGIGSQVKFAYAQGDQSILHDGVTHFYGYFRLASQFYGSLTARY